MSNLTPAITRKCACDTEGFDGEYIHYCRLHEAAQMLLDALIATKPEPEGCWCPPQKNGKLRTRHGPKCKQALAAIRWAERTD